MYPDPRGPKTLDPVPQHCFRQCDCEESVSIGSTFSTISIVSFRSRTTLSLVLEEYRYDAKIFRFSGDYRGVEGQREEEQPPGKPLVKKRTENRTVKRKKSFPVPLFYPLVFIQWIGLQ
jgi:hypothetical protein